MTTIAINKQQFYFYYAKDDTTHKQKRKWTILKVSVSNRFTQSHHSWRLIYLFACSFYLCCGNHAIFHVFNRIHISRLHCNWLALLTVCIGLNDAKKFMDYETELLTRSFYSNITFYRFFFCYNTTFSEELHKQMGNKKPHLKQFEEEYYKKIHFNRETIGIIILSDWGKKLKKKQRKKISKIQKNRLKFGEELEIYWKVIVNIKPLIRSNKKNNHKNAIALHTFGSPLDLSRRLDLPFITTLAFLNWTSQGDGGSQIHESSGSGSVDVASTVRSPSSTKPDSPGCKDNRFVMKKKQLDNVSCFYFSSFFSSSTKWWSFCECIYNFYFACFHA